MLIRLLLLNGLRASEVAGLRCGAVGEERGHTTVRVQRKGSTTTVEAVSPATSHALTRLLEARPAPDDDDPLLVDEGGGPLSRHAVARVDPAARPGDRL